MSKRDRGALRRIGIIRKKLSTTLDDCIAFARVSIELEQLSMKFRSPGGLWEFRIQQRQQFGGACAVEVRRGALLLLGVLRCGLSRVEDQ